jgi:hypothetical protein
MNKSELLLQRKGRETTEEKRRFSFLSLNKKNLPEKKVVKKKFRGS